uniref:CAF1B/HIR1 beta-propeller domain-containing protein n=1 Tax=Glossina pallidipes TaxID=7398 RepID=A0A1B0A0W6_GLOPL
MKCKIPEISWHNRDPVLSVDIQAKNDKSDVHRLASSGTDAHVLIWYMKITTNDVELDLVADLTRHQRAVNVVKWSPNGEMLASGDDESVIFIWKQKTDLEQLNILDNNNEQDKETWVTLKVLRGHMEDIYDLSWSPNSLYLVSGSVDNSAMIWDVQKGKPMAILSDHKSFVQGVAWDPKNQYIATLSTDRYLRIFDIQTKKILYRLNKSTLPLPESHALHGKHMRIFHDDTLQTFFRRLSFTPDGNLLLTPAGITDFESVAKPSHATYAFTRYDFRQPAIVLPCSDQYTIAVRCCPLLYRLRPYNAKKNPPVVSLPYRMIFAVATRSSVYFYDTQQKSPFGLISNIHYTRLTDITWSSDGRIVVVSSTDGFCSLITFEEGELGDIYEHSEAVLKAALPEDLLLNAKKAKKSKDNETHKLRNPSTGNKVDKQMICKDNSHSEKLTGSDAQGETKFKKVKHEIEEKICLNEGFREKDYNDPITDCDNDALRKVCKEKNTEEDIENFESDMKINTTLKSNHEVATTINVKGEFGLEKQVQQKNTSFDRKNRPKVNFRKKINDVVAKTSENNTNQLKSTVLVNKFNREEFASNHGLEKKSNLDENCSKITNILSRDIILDKEILSSDEKFESPKKKSRPLTSIMIRRHPRESIGSRNSISKCLSSPTSTIVNSHSKKDWVAKPIAIRRTPRNVMTTAVLTEEAMDAWPLTKQSNTCNDSKIGNTDGNCVSTEPSAEDSQKKELRSPSLVINDSNCEHTEEIRLVYEETVEERPSKDIADLHPIA